jgi:hypothetical protein
MMVGLGGFELPTSPLSGVRSNQLSYRPEAWIAARAPLVRDSLRKEASATTGTTRRTARPGPIRVI